MFYGTLVLYLCPKNEEFVSLPDPYPRNAHQKMRKSLIGLQTSFKPHPHDV